MRAPRLPGLAVALVLSLFTLPACSRGDAASGARAGEADDAVIATVDGDPVTRGDLERRVRRAAPADAADASGLRAGLFEQLVDERLLLAEARRRGLSLPPAELQAAAERAKAAMGPAAYAEHLAAEGLTDEGFRARVGETLLIRALLGTIPKPRPITEYDVRAYYQAHRTDFAQPEQFRARVITAASRGAAESIRAELAGGADFAKLAAERSTSPEKARGGDLGLVPRGQLPPEFDAALERLKPGELSPVVESPYGFHLFRLEERQAARQRTLDQARDEIFQVLNTSRLEATHEGWLAGLRGKAKIKVLDPALEAARAAASTGK